MNFQLEKPISAGGGFSLAASAFHQYSATPNGSALGYDADGSQFTFTNGTSDIR